MINMRQDPDYIGTLKSHTTVSNREREVYYVFIYGMNKTMV